MSIRLHQCIKTYNILEKPTDEIHDYFKERKTLYKEALLVNHLFRAASATALLACLPFPSLVNAGICLAGSLFYRLTVETHCAYKFALPAFAGAAAFMMGKSALIQIASGAAFASLGAFAMAHAALLPMTAYVVYILLTTDYDVDHR